MNSTAIPHPSPVRGTIARVAVQCVCPDTGLTGSFLFTGETHRNPGSRVTPVYPDCASLFIASRAEWESIGDAYAKRA